MVKVSILVVNYNYARYLDERIQSFLNQTYQDFELVIIDNGSSDNSIEIIKQYTHNSRVKAILFEDNISPFERWNNVVDNVEGEYIVIAPSDDSCQPELLEKLVEKLFHHPNVGLAYAQSWDIDDEGNRLRTWKHWTDSFNEDRWSHDFINSGVDECLYFLFKSVIPNSSGVLIRRDIFIKAGKFDLNFRYLADWLLWVKILLISDIAYISEPLNNYRTHSSSLTNATKLANELEERTQIIYFLFENLEVEPEVWEHVYNQTIGDLSRLIVDQKIGLKQFLRIYATLGKMDRNLNRRLLRRLAKKILKPTSYETENSGS